MIVDPITVAIALASPIVGFGCAVFAAGYFTYTLAYPPAPPAPPDPRIAAIEHVLEWVAEDVDEIDHPRIPSQARALLDTLHEARRNQMEAVYAANRSPTEAFFVAVNKIRAWGEQYHSSLQKHFWGGVDELVAACAAVPSFSGPGKLFIFLVAVISSCLTWVIMDIYLSLPCHPPRLPCPLEFSLEEARKYRLIPWQEMPRVLPVNGLAAAFAANPGVSGGFAFLPSAEAAVEAIDTTSDFDSAFAPATAPPR